MGGGKAACSIQSDSPTAESNTSSPEVIKKIYATYFFDGTCNNATNTRVRLLKETAKVLKDLYDKKSGEDSSYDNYYTNIYFLSTCLDAKVTNEQDELYIPMYIEGIGTINLEKDDQSGYSSGTGDTGIEKKVEFAKKDLLEKIKNFLKKPDPNMKVEIIVNTFGFSRGAAAARHFVHVILNGFNKAPNLKSSLNAFTISKLEFGFVGLFDTVSSMGMGKMFLESANNVKELGLDAIKNQDVKKVFHLVAADEHRVNFALTNISSAGGKGEEIYLPGVHSDIGGSYNPDVIETLEIYDSDAPVLLKEGLKNAFDDIQNLMNAGWFKKTAIVKANGYKFPKSIDELKIPFFVNDFEKYSNRSTFLSEEDSILNALNEHYEIYVRREGSKKTGIKNTYSRIPFKLMYEKAEASKLKFIAEKDTKGDLKITGNVDLENILKWVRANTGVGKFSWELSDKTLFMLRHDYFHFSAHWKRVYKTLQPMKPRYVGNKRKREIHPG